MYFRTNVDPEAKLFLKNTSDDQALQADQNDRMVQVTYLARN